MAGLNRQRSQIPRPRLGHGIAPSACMRLYLDENVPVILAPLLSAHGIDCLTARQSGNLGLSDEEQLIFTADEQRVLFTFNCRDFLSLAKHWHVIGRIHAGIILSKEFPLSELVRRFRHLVIHHRNHDLSNEVLWLPTPAHHPFR